MSLAVLRGANSPATNAFSRGKGLEHPSQDRSWACLSLVPLCRLTEKQELCSHITGVPAGILVLGAACPRQSPWELCGLIPPLSLTLGMHRVIDHGDVLSDAIPATRCPCVRVPWCNCFKEYWDRIRCSLEEAGRVYPVGLKAG